MVIAYHLVWTAYGWWLPNDPRGSMSHFIRDDVIATLGELHHGRKRIQPCSATVRAFHETSKLTLKFPLLDFKVEQFSVVASGIERALQQDHYTCYALAVMPDHVRVCLRKHRDPAEVMIANLQRETHLACREASLRDQNHPVWGGHGWKVFLETPEEVLRTIRYVEQNPVKLKLPVQRWPFVREYDNWPYHRKVRA